MPRCDLLRQAALRRDDVCNAGSMLTPTERERERERDDNICRRKYDGSEQAASRRGRQAVCVYSGRTDGRAIYSGVVRGGAMMRRDMQSRLAESSRAE